MVLTRVQDCYQAWRNYVAFWFFGVFNNFVYVVMLSSAVDILEIGSAKVRNKVQLGLLFIYYPTLDICCPFQNSGHNADWNGNLSCTVVGTGAVLLADIGPSLLLKLLAPVFIQRLHFHFKVCLSVLFSLSAFLIVSFSNSTALSLFGVVCASLSCGLGDVTFLTMVAFFDTALSVSSMRQLLDRPNFPESLMVYSPKYRCMGLGRADPPKPGPLTNGWVRLSWQHFIPYLELSSSQFCFNIPSILIELNVFKALALSSSTYIGVLASWSSGTGAAGIVGALAYAALTSVLSPEATLLAITFIPLSMLFIYFVVLDKPSNSAFRVSRSNAFWWLLASPPTRSSTTLHEVGGDAFNPTNEDVQGDETHLIGQSSGVAQVLPDWKTKKQVIRYELIYFVGLGLSHSQQYRWFQVVYQCGVFVSRSSLKLCRVKEIWAIAVLQGLMFILFLVQTISPFTNNIGAFCGVIFFEGSLGGLAYVNTFDRVLKTVRLIRILDPPTSLHSSTKANTREYSMSVAAFSDSLGITCAAFAAIPLHNWLCHAIAPKSI
ncbi:unnamed protein product [Taenia asiatica]|uniref:Battenin n=1 Tax=Taenia asiatica TaxID=60517 RepID=A0A158R6H1_TAEAS|nr:unnamed protein product [Taenia asiatica]